MSQVDSSFMSIPDNAAKRSVGRPPKSGAYSGAVLGPLIVEKRDAIITFLKGERFDIAKTDMVAVGLLARTLAHIEIIDRFIALNGYFTPDDKGNMVPHSAITKVYYAAINSAVRQCATLGLNPEARVRIGVRRVGALKDLGEVMAEAHEIEGEVVQ